MKLSASCMACMVSRQEEAIRNLPGKRKNPLFSGKFSEPSPMRAGRGFRPVVTEQLSLLHERFFGNPSFRELKRRYNGELFAEEAGISQR